MKLKAFLKMRGTHTYPRTKNIPLGLRAFISHAQYRTQVTQVPPSPKGAGTLQYRWNC